MGGVRGTYDRYAYHAEKKRAFEALAAQIDRIINPQHNVVPMRNTAAVELDCANKSPAGEGGAR